MSAHIDTLSITGNLEPGSCSLPSEYSRIEDDARRWVFLRFSVFFPMLYPLVTVGRPKGGVNGYTFCYGVDLDGVEVGHIAVGGNVNRHGHDGYQIYLNATGCTAATCHPGTWERCADAVDEYRARITRCDIAVDFVKGEYTVDYAAQQYADGGFDSWNKQRPYVSQMGNWLTEDTKGRTLYIGSRASSVKYTRVYEKGKQLGDSQSPWTRWEVEFKRQKGYELSTDMLRRPHEFWAGAYPIFQTMSEAVAETLAYVRESVRVTFNHLLHYMRQGYGRLLRVAEQEGFTLDRLLDGVPYELPRRMVPLIAGYAAPPVSNTGGVSGGTFA